MSEEYQVKTAEARGKSLEAEFRPCINDNPGPVFSLDI
jgi:hypothetical protein